MPGCHTNKFERKHDNTDIINKDFGNKMEHTKEKHQSEGVKHCCYGTCNSDTIYRHRESMKDVFFIPFPKPITQREKCVKWIKACGRPEDDFNIMKIKRSTYICSKHFVGEKGPTFEFPDPIPALLHTDEQVCCFHYSLFTLVICLGFMSTNK